MNRAAAVCTLLAAGASVAWAGTISDASFFSSISHTLITFETYGDGTTQVVVAPGGRATLYYDEYTDWGVEFDRDLSYVNDDGPDFDAAQAIGGSPEIGMPYATEDSFSLIFTTPVRAFGYWVINNNTVTTIPTFVAKNSTGGTIETVTFEGAMIDGTIGVADYGFMGIWASEDIASVDITKDAAMFDNLMFSNVPEPAAASMLALGGALLFARRRRAQRR